jgi:hypothetical protein
MVKASWTRFQTSSSKAAGAGLGRQLYEHPADPSSVLVARKMRTDDEAGDFRTQINIAEPVLESH